MLNRLSIFLCDSYISSVEYKGGWDNIADHIHTDGSSHEPIQYDCVHITQVYMKIQMGQIDSYAGGPAWVMLDGPNVGYGWWALLWVPEAWPNRGLRSDGQSW